MTGVVALQQAEAARLARQATALHSVAVHEAGHALACLAAGGRVLHLTARRSPRCEADLSALGPVDQCAFDLAGHLAQVLAGLPSPLEDIDWLGMGADGVSAAYSLGYARVPLAVVLCRAERLLTEPPGALVGLAALLAERGSLDGPAVAEWWDRAQPDNEVDHGPGDSATQSGAGLLSPAQASFRE